MATCETNGHIFGSHQHSCIFCGADRPKPVLVQPSLNIVKMYSADWQDFLASAYNLGHRYAITTPRCVILGTSVHLSMLMCRTDAQPAQLFLRARSHDVWEPIIRDDYDQIVAVEYGDDEPIDGVMADALAEMKPYTETAP